MSTEEVHRALDLDGKLVTVGDRIAYAATDGRSSGLRIGTVLKVTPAHAKDDRGYPRSVPTKLTVEVAASSGYWAPEKPVSINAEFRRFVKLG